MLYLFKLWYQIFGYPELYVVETDYFTLWNIDEHGFTIWRDSYKDDGMFKVRRMTREEILKYG